jgi:chromosome segregation ATPase
MALNTDELVTQAKEEVASLQEQIKERQATQKELGVEIKGLEAQLNEAERILRALSPRAARKRRTKEEIAADKAAKDAEKNADADAEAAAAVQAHVPASGTGGEPSVTGPAPSFVPPRTN